jgi:hypothetical protein
MLHVATIKLQKYNPLRLLKVAMMMNVSSMTLYRAIAAKLDKIIAVAMLGLNSTDMPSSSAMSDVQLYVRGVCLNKRGFRSEESRIKKNLGM